MGVVTLTVLYGKIEHTSGLLGRILNNRVSLIKVVSSKPFDSLPLFSLWYRIIVKSLTPLSKCYLQGLRYRIGVWSRVSLLPKFHNSLGIAETLLQLLTLYLQLSLLCKSLSIIGLAHTQSPCLPWPQVTAIRQKDVTFTSSRAANLKVPILTAPQADRNSTFTAPSCRTACYYTPS